MAWRIGVDSGGTFTDVCLYDTETSSIEVWKVSSTPADPSAGIAQGLEEGLARVGRSAATVEFFGHGTTVGTNALIQHRGVKTGLITTDGFRDLLEIGRQKRPELYDMQADKAPILVARDLRMQVPERINQNGSVDVALDEEAVREAARALKAVGVEAVAITFLYSFIRGEHEARARAIVEEELPGIFVSTSHEVAPEFREFERLSTAVVNAYLGPVMERYIRRLADKLTQLGLTTKPHLTQSNGGVISFETARRFPVRTVLSGPSTGVVAAQAVGKAAGYPDLITFDMGGTSSDIALLAGGECCFTSEADVHGYPIKAPMLDIHTVGAGGGSIAYVDSGGLLKVGPRSAGAMPGPVCYGAGNTEPTVTDANVVLQFLNPEYLLAGRMKIDRQLAYDAVARLAEKLGIEPMEAAEGILSVVTANMARAVRVVSIQKGYDPREYALMAFGGAGPLHAARLARELEMSRVIVPTTPGIMCAMGLLLTDLRADFATSRMMTLAPDAIDDMNAVTQDLVRQAAAWFDAEGVDAADRTVMLRVDMRYVGQNYELPIPLRGDVLDVSDIPEMTARFEVEHEKSYGFRAEGEPIQIVAFRAEAVGAVSKANFIPAFPEGEDAAHALTGARQVYLSELGGFTEWPIYDRTLLRCGNRVRGPAIIEQMDTTTTVLPGMTAIVDTFMNLFLEVAA